MKRQQLFEKIYQLKHSKKINDEFSMSFFTNKRSSFGRNFSSKKEEIIYIMEMQYALKEFNIYKDLVDGVFGGKTNNALNQLLDFLEIPKGKIRKNYIEGVLSNKDDILLKFNNSVINSKLNRREAKKISEKILKKKIKLSNEICLNNNGILSWEITLNNVSLNIELPNLVFTINAVSNSGKKLSFSNKKVSKNKTFNEVCSFKSFCLSKNPIIIQCQGKEIKGFSSVSIDLENYVIDIPLK
jgi:hypothetical protein